MRVLVCGGRKFDDWQMFKAVMLNVYAHRPRVSLRTTVISGGASGAGSMAIRWASEGGSTSKSIASTARTGKGTATPPGRCAIRRCLTRVGPT